MYRDLLEEWKMRFGHWECERWSHFWEYNARPSRRIFEGRWSLIERVRVV